MREILLTSSVLILALLALRRLFRKTLSRRVQYALWGLVLLRLLIPASLPAADFSLLTAAEPVVQNTEALYVYPDRETIWGQDGAYVWGPPDAPFFAVGPATEENTYIFQSRDYLGNPVIVKADYQRQFHLEDILTPVWYAGCAVMAGWFAFSNLWFWRKLQKGRKLYSDADSRLPVYLVEEGLSSPCLFGLFRPAIYLNPAATVSPEALRHVLAHEETHARHLDPVWALLRGVCLVVYWFDPLVWWAALASRTDCELACDEGALRRLGEAERVPYGRTLLSLIPVRKIPDNPLLSATTMTSDKRRLMDRITRIAENRRNLGTALFAAAALAALVCAVTFTGAKNEEKGHPLTKAELAYFNDAFFTESVGGGENRRRQFLTSLYDRPQNMDLYELLYIGTGLPEDFTEADQQYFDLQFSDYFMDVDSMKRNHVKLSVDNINAFLLENTGISYHDNRWKGLDSFWWNEEENCYYRFHLMDDTSSYNERLHLEPVTFTSGTREEDTVRLYYEETVFSYENARYQSSGPLCVTLREKPEGGWWFVSNEWAMTGGDPAYPDWDPIYTIPLDGLEPYEPEVMESIPYPYDYRNMLGGVEDPDGVLGDYGLMFFGNEYEVFAGVQHKARSSFPQPFWSFRPGAEGEYKVSFFRNLMGHDGFCISAYHNAPAYVWINDFYYLNEDGQPVHLAQTEGFSDCIDLDGNGEKELVSQEIWGGSLFFRRDGKYYQVDLDTALAPYWPEYTTFFYDGWDAAGRYLPFQARRFLPGEEKADEHRMMYFDGENFLIYNDQRHFEDHMIEWYDEYGVVKDAALDEVQALYQKARYEGALWDDWRITELNGPESLPVDGRKYFLWKVDYEVHTLELRKIAPGVQDQWGPPDNGDPGSLYLAFQVSDAFEGRPAEEGFGADFHWFFSFQHEGPVSEEDFREELSQALESGGLTIKQAIRRGPESLAPETARAALDELLSSETVHISLLAKGGKTYDADPRIWADRTGELMDDYQWSYAEDPGEASYVESILMIGRSNSLRFWPDSDLVLLHQYNQDAWFRAEPKPAGRSSIFYAMQKWYLIAAGSSVPIQETLEEILAGGAVFTLTSPEGAVTRTADAGQLQGTSAFTEDYDWTLAPDSYARSPVTLEIASQGGSFTFNPHNTLVKLQLPEESAYWFTVSPDARGRYIYDLVYGWYEAAN